MEDLTDLLKRAINEENNGLRCELAGNAAKEISSMLPFENQHDVLLEDENLVYHLMLLSPFLKRSIRLTLKSFLDKFGQNPQFLSHCWKSIEKVRDLEESHSDYSELSLRVLRNELSKKYQIKFREEEADSDTSLILETTFCKEIGRNLPEIKLFMIEFLESFQKYMEGQPDESPYLRYLMGFDKMLVSFLLHTKSKDVIDKVTSMVEEKQSEPKSIPVKADASPINNEDPTPIEGNPRTNAPPRKARNRLKTILDLQRAIATLSKRQGDDTPANVNRDENETGVMLPQNEDAVRHQNESESKKALIGYLETWLATDGVPIIGDNDKFLIHTFKDADNLDILFTFVFDPHFFPLNAVWSKRFLKAMQKPTGGRRFTLNVDADGVFQVRSYKVMEALTHERNYEFIISENRQYLEHFFTLLAISVDKDNFVCNMNHIVQMILHWFKKHQDLLVSYTLFYNFPFRFLKAIEFQIISNFFLALFGLHHEIHLTAENSARVSEYCRATGFFKDLATAILKGEESLGKDKMDQDYKPEGVSELIKFDFQALARLEIDAYPTKSERSAIFDALPDIDRIKDTTGVITPTVKARSGAGGEKIRNEPTKFKLSPEKAAKYPSIREKWDKIFSSPLHSIDYELKTNTSINDSVSRSYFKPSQRDLTDQIVEKAHTKDKQAEFLSTSHRSNQPQRSNNKASLKLRKIVDFSKDDCKELPRHSKTISEQKTAGLSSFILPEEVKLKRNSTLRRKLPSLSKSQLANPF